MNNFATTETEIMNLATMLVGTLSSLGVSESQILGLSAAMSSLGITAERGGSSMSKFFSEMATAVSEGGDSLQDFADVAGVTSEAFATMFESDPMSALQSFIDGMVRLEGEGQSFVATLDAMGITEVRLRDTLLRLAGGHETLNSALVESAQAYSDAGALQQEYDLMMQSTAAKWEVAKNKMVDVAIEIGGHLLPVIIELLEQSDGLISMVQDVAKWFGDLDDGVKRNIVTWGALAVPVGAVLTGFGSLVSAGGSVVGLLGKISKGTAELSVSLLRSLGYFKNIDGSATTVLSTMLKLNPAILGIVGGLALVGGGIWVWDKLTEDVRNAKQAVEDFPDISDITHEQAESLRAMGEAVGNVGTEIATLNSGSDLSTLQGNLSTIGSEIDRLNQDKIAQLRSDFQSLPSDIQGALAESVEASINNIEGQTQRVEEIFNRLTEIQKQAYDETGAMRAEYIQEVKGLTDELMSFYATALAETPEQYREIHANLTRTLGELNEQELEQRRQYITQSLDTERQAYQEHMDTLFQLKKEGHISDTEYYEQTEALQTAHNARMNALQQELVRTTVEQTKRQWEDIAEMNGTAFDENSAEWQAFLDSMAQDLGITRDELNTILDGIDFEGTFNGLAEASGVAFDQIGENAKAATRTAVSMWNEAVNTFEGEINSDNLEAFKQHVIDSGMTWDELNLVAKYANIDDNTREFLWNVIGATSEWDYMTLEEKTAKIETEGEEAFNDLMEKLGVDWESIQPTVHELILDGRSATDAIAIALRDTGKWDEMTLEEKMLLVDTLFADQNVVDSINNLEDWQKIELVEKYMSVNVDTEEGRGQIEALLIQWGIITDGETKGLWTETNAPDTLGTLSSLAMYWLLSMIGLPDAELSATDNATPVVETATGEIISFGEESGEAQLGANPEPVTSAVAEGVGAVQELDSTTADVQTSTNAEQGVTRPADTARMAVDNLDRSSASPVAKLIDYASATIQVVRDKLGALDGKTANTYVYTHYKATGSMSRRKHGTPYHQGGMAILGDGGKHEPYLTPQGYFGVSPNFDTPIDLPMGSKVWSSINKFKQEAMGNELLRPLVDQIPRLSSNLPKYASGTDRSFLDALTKMQVPIRDEVTDNVTSNQERSSGDVYEINLNIQNPIVREDSDIDLIADTITNKLIKTVGQQTRFKKGRRATR